MATPPCDLRWHKHQQKKHHKFCSGLPGAMLTTLFTRSVRKRRSFSDVNSWRSYEQCLFFSCFVCCIHVNMGVRTNVRMPVGFDSTALPFFICQSSLCLMGCMHRPLPIFIAHNPRMFWTFGARTYNQHQKLKAFRRLDCAEVCQDCGEHHPENCQSASYLYH